MTKCDISTTTEPGWVSLVQGKHTEAVILLEFLKQNETILLPFSNDTRFDLVLLRGNQFLRVQCKTAKLKNGVIHCPCCSTTHKGLNKGYQDQIDLFAFYCPENENIYLVPIQDAGGNFSEMHLRIDPTRNNQQKGVHWAKDYQY